MQSKTVYILGAGFSKAAGGPLQSEILQNLFEQAVEELDPDYRELYNENLNWLHGFLENEFYIDPSRFNDVALEDLYTPIDRCIIDNIAFRNIPPSELAQARQKINSLIVMLIDHKLRYRGSRHLYADQLARYLVQGGNLDSFSIISTNWDILIDNSIKTCLDEDKQSIDYCFPVLPYVGGTSLRKVLNSKGKQCVKVLKLHGSMNWLRCQCCQRIYVTFFEKIALDDYLKKAECRICQKAYNSQNSDKVRTYLVSDLVMPTFLKTLNNLHLKLVWQAATDELSEATKIVFMGYSFPSADFELRQLLSRSVNRASSIDVILHATDNPNGSNLDRKSFSEYRYRAFFGKHNVTFYYCGVKNYIQDIINQGSV